MPNVTLLLNNKVRCETFPFPSVVLPICYTEICVLIAGKELVPCDGDTTERYCDNESTPSLP